jgi:hypothetical protein
MREVSRVWPAEARKLGAQATFTPEASSLFILLSVRAHGRRHRDIPDSLKSWLRGGIFHVKFCGVNILSNDNIDVLTA